MSNGTCIGSLANARRNPILLSPGTGPTPEQDFGFNYEHALTALGIPWCAVTSPYDTLGDLQTAAEYLVHSIRTMSRASCEECLEDRRAMASPACVPYTRADWLL